MKANEPKRKIFADAYGLSGRHVARLMRVNQTIPEIKQLLDKGDNIHSAYLLGAKNGSKLRYDGLKGCTDYKKAAQIIKDGGYATSLTYVDKLCSIIERWKLTQSDVAGEASDVVKDYRVRKSWEDAKSQLGAYTLLANAKAMADKHPGYEVYDWNGKQVYPEVAEGAAGGMRVLMFAGFFVV